jgi:hypothetical protein
MDFPTTDGRPHFDGKPGIQYKVQIRASRKSGEIIAIDGKEI